MTRTLLVAVAALLCALGPAAATDGSAPADPTAVELWQAEPERIFDGAEVELSEFRWIARPIVVFADTPADPRFQQQMDLLGSRMSELVERDVVVITDTDPAARTSVRETLRPRGFMLALLGKDGGVYLRKPFPWSVRELTRSIDKMPMRQQEMRDRNRPGG